MVNQRESGWVRVVREPAKSRLERGECPSCGKPKSKWSRRTDWTCCSVGCTDKFEDYCIVRSWADLRTQCFKRDNHACVKCGCVFPAHKLIADHFVPIALGGAQWDLNNVQTLCLSCNKVKTKEDAKNIAKLRSIERKLVGGQKRLKGVV